jgi:hypothetical protein
MRMVDLVKMFSCKKDKILKNTNFFVAYTLFRVILNKADYIPGVGSVKLNIKDGLVTINLDNKWKRLLKGNCEGELVEYIKEQLVDVENYKKFSEESRKNISLAAKKRWEKEQSKPK